MKYLKVPGCRLDIYVPAGDVVTDFILFSPNKASVAIPQAKEIQIRQTYRQEDDRWLLSFVLLDQSFSRMFDKFCRDVFEEVSEVTDKKQGPDRILAMFSEWKRLFGVEKIDVDDIQGAIGELIFLHDVLIPRYGEAKALDSWTRGEFGKQDFMIDDTWYEVKTTRLGSERVVISSVEQLDNHKSGHLAVITLQPSTRASESAFTLNTLYQSVNSELNEHRSKKILSDSMKCYGIPDDRLEDLIYELVDVVTYSVKDGFPRLLHDNIPAGVKVPSYEIALSMIEPYKEGL